MNLIEKIENIKEILKSGDNLFFKSGNVVESDNYIIVGAEYGIFDKWGYTYIYKDGSIKLFNVKSRKFDIEYEDSISIAPSYYNKDHFLLFRRTDKIIQEVLNFEIIRSFTLSQPHNYFLGSRFISISGESLIKRNKLACYKIQDDNTPLWEFSLPDGLNIFGPILLIKNILYFHGATLDARRLHKIYGLGIDTGNILWEIAEPIGAYHLNNANKLVYGFGANQFSIVDPMTGQIVMRKDMSEYYNQGIRSNVWQNTVQDDRLWFISGRGENLKFGALDTHSGDMVFVQDYPLPNDAQMDNPVFHNGKLYLRDENNVLHIFE